MPSLNRSANAKVLRKIQRIHMIASAYVKSRIRRSVVDHDIIEARSNNVIDGIKNRLRLVVSRNNDKHPRLFCHPYTTSITKRPEVK